MLVVAAICEAVRGVSLIAAKMRAVVCGFMSKSPFLASFFIFSAVGGYYPAPTARPM